LSGGTGTDFAPGYEVYDTALLTITLHDSVAGTTVTVGPGSYTISGVGESNNSINVNVPSASGVTGTLTITYAAAATAAPLTTFTNAGAITPSALHDEFVNIYTALNDIDGSSAARGVDYATLDLRLEAGEQEVVDARNGSATLDDRLDSISATVGALGNVPDPTGRTDGEIIGISSNAYAFITTLAGQYTVQDATAPQLSVNDVGGTNATLQFEAGGVAKTTIGTNADNYEAYNTTNNSKMRFGPKDSGGTLRWVEMYGDTGIAYLMRDVDNEQIRLMGGNDTALYHSRLNLYGQNYNFTAGDKHAVKLTCAYETAGGTGPFLINGYDSGGLARVLLEVTNANEFKFSKRAGSNISRVDLVPDTNSVIKMYDGAAGSTATLTNNGDLILEHPTNDIHLRASAQVEVHNDAPVVWTSGTPGTVRGRVDNNGGNFRLYGNTSLTELSGTNQVDIHADVGLSTGVEKVTSFRTDGSVELHILGATVTTPARGSFWYYESASVGYWEWRTFEAATNTAATISMRADSKGAGWQQTNSGTTEISFKVA
jgi:hypothetical protein